MRFGKIIIPGKWEMAAVDTEDTGAATSGELTFAYA